MAKNASRKGAPVMDATTDSAAEIAEHISAIFNHPATPVDLYNALADAVQDLHVPQSYYNSVEFITLRLVNNIRQGNEKTVAPPATATDARQHDLAELISTVLRHPETPEAIREDILQSMCQYSYDDTAPEHIRLILSCEE